MENFNLKAQQDIPKIRMWIDKLTDLIQEMFREPIKFSIDEDHFGFMGLFFLDKQSEHIKSILLLVDGGQGRDAELIARSMIEGLGQLLWAAENSQNRALRWRAFAWVYDWRVMNKKIAAGEDIEQERRLRIEQGLAQYGEQFLTNPAKKNRHEGKPLPSDPYSHNWTGHNLTQIFDLALGKTYIQRLYAPFSEWQHWSPVACGEMIIRAQNEIISHPSSFAASATALAVGFGCLAQTAELVSNHLSLGFHSRIEEIIQGCLKEIGIINTKHHGTC